MTQHLSTKHHLSIYCDSGYSPELHSAIHSEECILVSGFGLSALAYTEDGRHPPSSQKNLLERMVEWCVKEGVINQCDTIENLYKLIRQNAVSLVCYQIEEYLAEKEQQQRCLKEVLLHNEAQITELHRHLVQLPFQGYITTNYDTFIEAAYFEVIGCKLPKFYITSIQGAIEAYQNKQPFILKLHGDIDEPYSILLNHQNSSNSPTKSTLTYLQTKISASSILFFCIEPVDHDQKELMNFISTKSTKFWIVTLDEQDLFYVAQQSKRADIISSISEQTQATTVNDECTETNTTNTQVRRPTNQSQSIASASKYSTVLNIFLSYVDEDEAMVKEVEKMLILLKRRFEAKNCEITIWYSNQVLAGKNRKETINYRLSIAHIVLFFISRDFLVSELCYNIEIEPALCRHHEGKACVIPIILRPAPWEEEAFGELGVLPTKGKPVSRWEDPDEAYMDIYRGIKKAIEDLVGMMP